jgi:formylglycine-generating enzyme required for sulfatase activity
VHKINETSRSIATSTFSDSAITPTNMISGLPTEIIDNQGITMRLVPAGEFTMGSDRDSSNNHSLHRVYLDAFYMDKYEVTNTRYEACVTADVCDPPHETKSYFHSSYYGDSQYDNFPVINVDWYMAKTYCE